jgi:hypothetical protein
MKPLERKRYEELVASLAFTSQEGIMPPKEHHSHTPPSIRSSSYSYGYTHEMITITVSLLGGDSLKFRVSEGDTVIQFMDLLATHFHVPTKSQRLIHNGQQLKVSSFIPSCTSFLYINIFL